MPKAGGGADSMQQGLQQILGMIGSLMAAPDADIGFLGQLQLAIAAQIKQGQGQSIAGGPRQMGPGGQAGGGMNGLAPGQPLPPGAMGPGGPPQEPSGLGGPPGGPEPGNGPPGGMGPGAAPNPDELRRVLGANAVTQ